MSNNSENEIKKPEYGAQSIKVLEGLDAVRKRPAMYIGSVGPQGLHHLVYEIVDNSVDEALAGFCNNILVTLNADGSCTVEDNGRGIPTGIHPTEGISAAEVALTKLHAGGKFDKDVYKFSGGLHGVGVSVVNALSKKLLLEIHQNGNIYQQEYEAGKPLARLEITGKTDKRGTIVTFYPDPEIFKETVEFNFETLSARLRELAFLNKGLKITIKDERSNKSHEFYFEGGIISFVEHINSKKSPLFPEVIYDYREDATSILEIAMQYNEGFAEQVYSFVNNINTIEGGTHVAGFKAALTKACNKRAQEFNILKEGDDNFSSEDVREGLVAVINVKIAEPQFEGQTKGKLGNSEVKGIVESWFFGFIDTYFEENPAIAKKILQKAVIAMQARNAAKKARELTRRKNVLETVLLPGKLVDCSNDNPADTELFIVEGDSAGGSAKQGRDRNTQAILPLKGKILNVEKARFDKMLGNEEIKALISAIGAGIGDAEFNPDKIRYHKIILMTDADVDGAHIRTLLLTLFFRYMKGIIEKGYLYIAQPPLYKAKIGKKEQYLKDDKAFKQFIFDWAKDNLNLNKAGSLLSLDSWNSFVTNLFAYQDKLDTISGNFKIANQNGHVLIQFLDESGITKDTEFTEVIEKVKNFFNIYTVHVTENEHRYLTFKNSETDWKVDYSFLTNPEVLQLLTQYRTLSYLNEGWVLQIVDREKSVSGVGVLNLYNNIIKTSKSFMTVQRYKGLGEMNADQLWETAMDPKNRILMQVSIGDALEADAWFDTLMGSDVAGRKEFIQENGRFVKNLDI